MTTLTLYEIAAEFREIADKIAQMDIDPQTLADTLEGAAYQLEMKARSCGYVLANLEATADAYDTHAKAVSAKAKSLQARADWLRSYILTAMQSAGISEVKGDGLTLKIRKNPAKVDIFDQAMIPSQYMVQQPPPEPFADKRAIMDAIKAGADVPGCRTTQGERLEVKP